MDLRWLVVSGELLAPFEAINFPNAQMHVSDMARCLL